MRPRPCSRLGRSVLDRNDRQLRVARTSRAVDTGRGRRMPTAYVVPTAPGSANDSNGPVGSRDMRDARSNRVGLMREPNPGPESCGTASLAEDMGGRLDLVEVGGDDRRTGVDSRSRRNLDRRVDRGRCARFRGWHRRTGIFGCDRGSSRNLIGGHLRRRILIVRRVGSRACDRRRDGRADWH